MILAFLFACRTDDPGAAERAAFARDLTVALEAARVASAAAHAEKPCGSWDHPVVATFCDAPDRAKAEAIVAAGLPLDCLCHLGVSGLSVGIGGLTTTVGEGTNVVPLVERAAMLDEDALVEYLVAHGAKAPTR